MRLVTKSIVTSIFKVKIMKTNNILVLFCCLMAHTLFGQCSQYPTLNLGNDTTLCLGSTITYTVPPGYDDFQWSTGAFSNSITVSTASTIWLQVLNNSGNLVVNGDFESGNVGFTSGYIYGTGGSWGLLSNPGQYAIATSPNLTHTNFSNFPDHTPTGVGNMLVANGASTANVAVWNQTVTVSPNTDYNFSAWIANALNDVNVSNLQFFINNVQLGPIFSTTPIAGEWQEFNQVWNSGAATTAALSIRNQNTAGGGNDFVIDDITFQSVCVQTDTVTIAYDPSTISAGNDISFCANGTDHFIASANFPNAQFTWETGATGSNFTPTTSGMYTVSTTTPFGCTISDSALVTITPMPWDFDLVDSQPTSCGTNNGVVFCTTTGTFTGPPVYTWHGPGASNTNQINASVWQNLPAGWYYISIENQGCFRYDSVQVTTLNAPIAVLSATPTVGYAPLAVSFTNSSQNGLSYAWDLGNGGTATTTDLSGQNTIYTTPGTYTATLIANNGNCVDTSSVIIIVNELIIPPPPVIVPVAIEFPNVITPNNDLINDVFEPNVLLNIVSLEITVVNRWGNMVYHSNSTTSFWDGKQNGNTLSEGVYFYTYKAIGAQQEVFEGQGNVTLTK
jgi:gliding motility-associated-like protein